MSAVVLLALACFASTTMPAVHAARQLEQSGDVVLEGARLVGEVDCPSGLGPAAGEAPMQRAPSGGVVAAGLPT